ncbi:Chloroperoxidase [Trichoderma ceciliae]
MASKIAIASLVALSAASEGLRPWQAPGPEDSRSPCPMLNTLANHGYLPHDGRHITAQQFGDAITEALNVNSMFGVQTAKYFMRAANKSSIDLVELNRPGILQHIASLTRDDVTSLDSVDVTASQDRIHHLLQDSSTDCITVASLAQTRLHVEALSSPEEMSLKDTLLAYVEAGLLLVMMNEEPVPSGWSFPPTNTYCAPKQIVKTWLTEERLPEELGWKRSERTLGVMDFLPAMKGILEEKRLKTGKGPLWKGLVPSFLFGAESDL